MFLLAFIPPQENLQQGNGSLRTNPSPYLLMTITIPKLMSLIIIAINMAYRPTAVLLIKWDNSAMKICESYGTQF